MREIAERSFAYRDLARQITQLEEAATKASRRFDSALNEAGCDLPISVVLGSGTTGRCSRAFAGSKTADAR